MSLFVPGSSLHACVNLKRGTSICMEKHGGFYFFFTQYKKFSKVTHLKKNNSKIITF